MWRPKLRSLRSRMVVLMLLCWFLPLLLLAGVNTYYLSGDRLETRIEKEVDRLKFSDANTMQNLEHVVEASLEASYDPSLLMSYHRFAAGELSPRELLVNGYTSLREKYGRDEALELAVLWFRKDPKKLYCEAMNTGQGTTYADVRTYWKQDHEAVAGLAATLGTRGGFFFREGRLYYVRNLCDDHYFPVATLVLRVNQASCFAAYRTFAAGTDVTVLVDDCRLQFSDEPVTEEETGLTEMGGSAGYTWSSRQLNLYHRRSGLYFRLTALLRITDSAALSPFNGFGPLMLGTLALILPLMALLLAVFHRFVNRPVHQLMDGAKEIEAGHLGFQLGEEGESTEFRYLTDAFNAMSQRLEYQFQHIYKEELALRDARIKVLQSQINPHFMNNTLEIINWEARLAGNDKVSRMIEALATLMNAGMDRKSRPLIPLAEEMVSVEAYLYITSQRLGDRLTILNEFPEEIMDCPVPRLILQPVIENAIEHGVMESGQGTVLLYGWREGDTLILEISNETVLTPQGKAKIARLLDPDYDTSREPSLNLGIANVNQRLRILYGPDSGLTVFQSDPEHVTSRLTIHLNGGKQGADGVCVDKI